jgi:glycosyltransferase involved in cell wall biosynthesis
MAQISIIVPVYNVEKYLRRCLDSLLAQTFRDIEIICVDDGSTDGSLQILDEYASANYRIKVIHQLNQGVSVARNTGLQEVTSPYVMFCDPDDEYAPSMCKEMYESITSSGDDACRCGIDIVRSRVDLCLHINIDRYQLPFHGANVSTSDIVCKGVDGSVCNKIYRKDLIDKYLILFPPGVIHEDCCFHVKYILSAKTISFIDEKLYRYILRDGGYMGATDRDRENALDYIRIMDDIYAFMQRNGLWEKKAELFFKFYAYFFNIAYHSMPGEFKDECYDLALPLLNKIGEKEIVKKSDGAYKKALTSILKRDYVYFGRRYLGIGPLKLVKIVSKVSRFEVRLLGIPIYIKRYPYAPL